MGTGWRSAVAGRAFMQGCRRRWISWVGRIGNGSAWLISSELDVGETDTSEQWCGCIRWEFWTWSRRLRIAEIPNECPCLVGSDHISKWAMVLDCQRAQHRIGQREGNVIPASGVCVCVLNILSIGGSR